MKNNNVFISDTVYKALVSGSKVLPQFSAEERFTATRASPKKSTTLKQKLFYERTKFNK